MKIPEKWQLCKCGHEYIQHDYSHASDPFYRKYKDCRKCDCKRFIKK